MTLSEESFIDPNTIVGEIAKQSGDPGFEWDVYGYYLSLVQEALAELSMDTLFLELSKTYKLEDGCRELTLPEGAFNVRDVFGHNSEECIVDNSTNIWYKHNYRKGFSRDSWSNGADPFYRNRSSRPHSQLYFCGISNGVVHLSESCMKFKYVTVFYNGVLANLGEAPVVPIFFKKAIVNYGVVNCLVARIAQHSANEKVNGWQFAYAHHKKEMDGFYDGSWEKARIRVKKMDKKQRKDFREYFARLRY